MYKNIKIFDTTLRDGEQAPGNSMTVEQKIQLFQKIDAMNVDYIETGFPASSNVDFQATKSLCEMPHRAKITAFARPMPHDINIAVKSFSNDKNVQLQLLFTGSELHLVHKRKISIEQSIYEIKESVAYARNLGVQCIAMGLEDSSRSSVSYIHKLIEAGLESGCTTVVLADTVGAWTPNEADTLVRSVKRWIGEKMEISVHCHNDLGLATANALAAIGAGADCVQTTLCGIGERAGNTALEELATVLYYKSEQYHTQLNINLKNMYDACHFLAALLKMTIHATKPILGKNVFTTAAGIHIHGLKSNPLTYEFVNPKLFGKKTEFIINRHAGRQVIWDRLESMNYKMDTHLLEQLYNIILNSPNAEKYNNNAELEKLYLMVAQSTQLKSN